MRNLLPIALAVVLVLSMAAHAAAESASQEAAYGAGSFFSTLVYAPVKTSFCILGGVTSAFTLPFGGTDTAGKVATAACGGTWIISPDTLKGKERVHFVGGS